MKRTTLLLMVLTALGAVFGQETQPTSREGSLESKRHISPPIGTLDDLVVHEWGTFTTVAGRDGSQMDWRPLSQVSDLPSFVHSEGQPSGFRHCPGCTHASCACYPRCIPVDGKPGSNCKCKNCEKASVRMETPVIYFYTNTPQVVSVDVRFPQGRITEWYPMVRNMEGGIHWGGIQLEPGKDLPLLRENRHSHYYPAREVDAVPLSSCSSVASVQTSLGNTIQLQRKKEYEKFLFYRGVGNVKLPFSASLDHNSGAVNLTNKSDCPLVHSFLFSRSLNGNEWRMAVLDELAGAATSTFPILEKVKDPGAIRQALQQILVDQGLFIKEAQAMIKTWDDSWFEPGIRVFYILPQSVTESILPLTISPKPSSTVRVLVGRIELFSVEQEDALMKAVKEASHEDRTIAEESHRVLRKLGRFAEPLLEQYLQKEPDDKRNPMKDEIRNAFKAAFKLALEEDR